MATIAPAQQAAGKAAAVPANPFTKAAQQRVEHVSDDTRTLGASPVSLTSVEVPASGYLRHLLVLVELTGLTAASTLKADGPFSVIQELTLTDVNGQPLYGPLTGYEAYLAHKYGGYSFDSDPKRSPAYSTDANGNFSFLLRIPVEVTERDAFGALPNMNASSTYRVRLTLAGTGDVYSALGAGTPSARVRMWMETWSLPNGADLRGVPNVVAPPAVGTTQYWSKEVKNVSAGQQTHRFSRVGNAIRGLVLVTRDASGARVDTIFPDPLLLLWDGRQLATYNAKVLRHHIAERYGYTGTQLDTGVYVLDRTHDFDGHPGGELRDGYLHTTSASRLEVQGSFGAAGTLTILTNDIAAFAGAATAGAGSTIGAE